MIAKAIEQLQSGADDQNKPRLVVYPRGDADPQTLLLMLTSLVPTARLAVDSQTGGLAAWATPEEQDTIRKAIEEMSKEEVTASKPTTKAYALKNITAAAALPVLTSAVPTAKVSAGADESQVVAVAQPRDHQMLQAIVQEIDVEGAAAAKSSVAVYKLENKTSSTAVLYAMSVFRSAFPKANFTLGADAGEFVAWASAKDHEGIKALVDQLNAPPAPENAPKVALYPLKTITATSAMTVLQAAVPGATLTADPADPQRLTASARPAEHEMIKTILAEIDVEGDPGSQPSVVVYQLKRQTSATTMSYAISLLTQAFPRARLLQGTEVDQFVAWASAKDHEGIKALVDRLNAGPPPEEAPEATVYSLQHISATTALNLLTTAVPKAKLSPDTEDTRRLTAFASPADQAAIKAILAKIDVAGDAAGGATVGIYKLEGTTAASSLYYTLTVFRTAFPKATFSLGAEANQFVAWATAKDHAGIKALVEQLNAAPAPEDTPKIALYPLQWITAATATTVLQAAVPKATFTADPADPQRLTVLARPADHERIKDDGGRDRRRGRRRRAFGGRRVRAGTADFAHGDELRAEPADAGLSPRSLPAGHGTRPVRRLGHRQGSAGDQGAGRPSERRTAAGASARGHRLLPEAHRGHHRADPADHRGPQGQTQSRHGGHAPLDRLRQPGRPGGDQEDPGEDRRRGRCRRRCHRRRLQARRLDGRHLAVLHPDRLSHGVPESHVLRRCRSRPVCCLGHGQGSRRDQGPGRTTERRTAAGRHAQGGVVHAAVDHRDDRHHRPDAGVPQSDVYRRPGRSSAADRSGPPRRPREDQDRADRDRRRRRRRRTLVGRRLPAPAADVPHVDDLRDQPVDPGISARRFLTGTEPNEFVAWASAKDHEEIKALVDRLNAGPPPEEAPVATVYSLKHILATTALSVLTPAVPQAKLTPDTEDTRRLTAFASPADQATIKAILDKIDVEGDLAGGETVAVYVLEGQASSIATYYTLSVFRTAFPKAVFSTGADPGQFIAWASAKDHAGIKTLVEQINAGPPPEQKPQVELYTLKSITATSAAAVLQAAVPKATVTVDPANAQRLTASARAADHETIKAILAKIDVKGEPGTEPSVVVYQLEQQTSPTAMSYAFSMLTQAFPRARFVLGTEVGQFVAWATAKDQEEIKALVDRLNAGPPPEEAPVATVYSLKHILATTALNVLTAAVPKAKLTPDTEDTRRLTAYASPADQATIKGILDKIDVEGDLAGGETVAVYQLEGQATATSLYYTLAVFRTAFPKATFSTGADPGQFVAWASAKDHVGIKALVEQLNAGLPPEQKPQVTLYTLKFITGAAASQVLQTAVPNATFTTDPDDPQRLTASARAADHETIKTVLDEIDVEGEGGGRSTVQVYKLLGQQPTASMTAALTLLTTAFPRARFSPGHRAQPVRRLGQPEGPQGDPGFGRPAERRPTARRGVRKPPSTP